MISVKVQGLSSECEVGRTARDLRQLDHCFGASVEKTDKQMRMPRPDFDPLSTHPDAPYIDYSTDDWRLMKMLGTHDLSHRIHL